MNANVEIPAVVFRKVLPFIRTKDMRNVEKAVKCSPVLYNEYSFHTKKHAKKFVNGPLICPYCLIGGGYFNPWHKLLIAVYGQHAKTWAAAEVALALFRCGPYILVEALSLTGLKQKLVEREAPMIAQATPENRFRRWTQIWAEERTEKKKVDTFLTALKDLEIFHSAADLVTHVETAHHPSGDIWKHSDRPPVRAHEIDQLTSLIMAKEFQNSIITKSPRRNKNYRDAFKTSATHRRKRMGQNRRFLTPPLTPISGLYNDHVQNLHRTMALAYLLEDNLQRANRQHLVINPRYHKLLALRNFLACQIEVFEDIEFEQLPRDNACHFGMITAINIILDTIIKLPY